MGQVTVDIGGRAYSLSCRDGDEDHLIALGAGIAAKADGLTRSLGAMSEPRLLLMAALMVADELHEVRNGHGSAAQVVAPIPDVAAEAQLAAVLDRAERLAARLSC